MPASLPLEGFRVVEMSHMIMGPACGMFLAFLGAEVIKVEPPEGDKTRNLTGMGSGFFPTFNRGKKSVVLDIKSDQGRADLERLLTTADAFVENFREESLRKMGLDPDSLRARFPRLIVASCKGFLKGPYENRAAMDELVQMMTGMAYMTGPTGRPLRIGSSANDIMGGLFAAFGVLGEVIGRQKTGEGAVVRAGLFENCLLLVAQHMVQFDIEGTESPPMPERVFSWPVYDIFQTAGGRQVFVGAVTETQWTALCGVLALDDLLADPRLQTRPQQIEARDWTLPIIADAIGGRDYREFLAACEAASVLCSPIARPAEMYDDPHVLRPGGLLMSHYGDGKVLRAPGLPYSVDGVSPHPRNVDLPAIGQHTDEVLAALPRMERA
ncbi:CoA transferase [Paracoccus sp. M683]|uniref:CaiB/BaiF CoA transferase family protein n=1 Tax=Paracoccus sp. M683 TaxID=2594268 RepID=UPI00117F47C0|nr:CoA transferase [Paracoccus sp. M683]TRW95364.1 CoA transferase [Paracoccus sp. M683]